MYLINIAISIADLEWDRSLRTTASFFLHPLHVIGPLFLVDISLRRWNVVNNTASAAFVLVVLCTFPHDHTAGRVPGSLNVWPLDEVSEDVGMSFSTSALGFLHKV